MKAAPPLLQRWKDALVFHIGEGDHASLDQMPCPQRFPDRLPTRSLSAPIVLGHVLAVGLLKMHRPWCVEAGGNVVLDPCGGWLADFADLAGMISRSGSRGELARRFPGYSTHSCGGFLGALGTFVEMALLAPERLAELVKRIDAADNATLHDWAMRAVQGQADDFDFFEGLYL